MSTKTNYTPEEAAQIVFAYGQQKMASMVKSLRELRERELSKAIVPPHKHTVGTTSSGGVEDIPPSKTNPKGKNDALKQEMSAHRPEETSGEISPDDLKKEELCKKCGKMHDLSKGCDGLDMGKAMLKDSKGKEKDTGINPSSVLPDDAKSKEVSADGSGGDIKKGKVAKANPPMAKPPSGKNMATAVPTSKPAMAKDELDKAYISPTVKFGSTKPVTGPAPTPKPVTPEEHEADKKAAGIKKEVKEMVVHGGDKPKPAPKGADYSIKSKGSTTSYVRKEELDKGVMADIAMRNSPPGPEAGPAPVLPKSPTPEQHADRASQFADFMPGAGQTGHLMGTPGMSANRPGIFGRLSKLGKSELAKAVPTKTGVTQPRPGLKPAAAGLSTVGGDPALTHMTATAPSKTAILPKPVPAPTSPVARNVVGKPQLPKSPVLTARPALKPAGAGLATAGASSENTEGDKTQQTATKAARPGNVKAVI